MMGRMENEGERRLHHPYLSVSQPEKREREGERKEEREKERRVSTHRTYSLFKRPFTAVYPVLDYHKKIMIII